jgi:pyruvate formate lyase activating enzyme
MTEQRPTIIGRIHSIESFGAVDGPGIRYVLFLQGCPMRCLYCHNPDSWDSHKGRVVSVDEMMADILSYRNFIRKGGVTISGGEPLLQLDFVLEILRRCRALGLHTAIDTAGSVPVARSAPVIDAADLLLLDIKALDGDVCRKLTGMSNRHELDTLDYCEKTGKPVWVRHVVVPGITLDEAKLDALARYLASYRCVEKVELLPFHKMGEFKWRELGLDYELAATPAPTADEMRRAKAIFESHGLKL